MSCVAVVKTLPPQSVCQ